MQLWASRMIQLSEVKTYAWTTLQLHNALARLKKNKARDPHGMQNELFKDGCIGSDLELALLTMFNGIKDHQDIPPFFNLSNITNLYKNKGSREDLDNDRRIFVDLL